MEAEEYYQQIIIDLNRNPQNYGNINSPTATFSGGNPTCGDEVSFDIIMDGDKISKVKFCGDGCAVSRAASSMVTDRIKGMTIQQVLSIDPQWLFSELGNIVHLRHSCALLGLNVIKKGLATLS